MPQRKFSQISQEVIEQWTEEDVLHWLQGWKLVDFADDFRGKNGMDLLQLTVDDIKQLSSMKNSDKKRKAMKKALSSLPGNSVSKPKQPKGKKSLRLGGKKTSTTSKSSQQGNSPTHPVSSPAHSQQYHAGEDIEEEDDGIYDRVDDLQEEMTQMKAWQGNGYHPGPHPPSVPPPGPHPPSLPPPGIHPPSGPPPGYNSYPDEGEIYDEYDASDDDMVDDSFSSSEDVSDYEEPFEEESHLFQRQPQPIAPPAGFGRVRVKSDANIRTISAKFFAMGLKEHTGISTLVSNSSTGSGLSAAMPEEEDDEGDEIYDLPPRPGEDGYIEDDEDEGLYDLPPEELIEELRSNRAQPPPPEAPPDDITEEIYEAADPQEDMAEEIYDTADQEEVSQPPLRPPPPPVDGIMEDIYDTADQEDPSSPPVGPAPPRPPKPASPFPSPNPGRKELGRPFMRPPIGTRAPSYPPPQEEECPPPRPPKPADSPKPQHSRLVEPVKPVFSRPLLRPPIQSMGLPPPIPPSSTKPSLPTKEPQEKMVGSTSLKPSSPKPSPNSSPKPPRKFPYSGAKPTEKASSHTLPAIQKMNNTNDKDSPTSGRKFPKPSELRSKNLQSRSPQLSPKSPRRFETPKEIPTPPAPPAPPAPPPIGGLKSSKSPTTKDPSKSTPDTSFTKPMPNGAPKVNRTETSSAAKVKPPPPQKSSLVHALMNRFETRGPPNASSNVQTPSTKPTVTAAAPKKPVANQSPSLRSRKDSIDNLMKKFEKNKAEIQPVVREESPSPEPIPTLPPRPGTQPTAQPAKQPTAQPVKIPAILSQWQRRTIEPSGGQDAPSLPSRTKETEKIKETVKKSPKLDRRWKGGEPNWPPKRVEPNRPWMRTAEAPHEKQEKKLPSQPKAEEPKVKAQEPPSPPVPPPVPPAQQQIPEEKPQETKPGKRFVYRPYSSIREKDIPSFEPEEPPKRPEKQKPPPPPIAEELPKLPDRPPPHHRHPPTLPPSSEPFSEPPRLPARPSAHSWSNHSPPESRPPPPLPHPSLSEDLPPPVLPPRPGHQQPQQPQVPDQMSPPPLPSRPPPLHKPEAAHYPQPSRVPDIPPKRLPEPPPLEEPPPPVRPPKPSATFGSPKGQFWYHGNLDRKGAEAKLRRQAKDGSYIIRDSTRVAGEYSLSLWYGGAVKHLRIRLRSDQKFVLGEEKADELPFDTVMDLVEYHRNEPLVLKSGGEVTLKYGCPH